MRTSTPGKLLFAVAIACALLTAADDAAADPRDPAAGSYVGVATEWPPRSMALLGRSLIATSVTGLVATALLAGFGVGEDADAERLASRGDAQLTGDTLALYNQTLQTRDRLYIASGVVAAVSVAAGVTGVVLLSLPQEEGAEQGLQVSATPGGLAAAIRF